MLVVPNHEIDSDFFSLCSRHNPKIICDIGTRDCSDAIKLKLCSPESTVMAFEANPENYFDFCISDKVTRSGVISNHIAVSDVAGVTRVCVPHYASRSEGGNAQQRGMSSLRKKANTSRFVEYTVPTTTIDTFFSYVDELEDDFTFAFWIDVEGLAFEVLSGMTNILKKTLFLKVEVEDQEYYSGQKFSKDVMELLKASSLVAYKCGDPMPGQYDLLYVDRSIYLSQANE